MLSTTMFLTRCRAIWRANKLEQEKLERSTTDLINAVREVFETEAATDSAKAPQLQRALTLMQELRLNPDRPEANKVPGCRHLFHVLDLGDAGPAAAVSTAIRDLEPTLHIKLLNLLKPPVYLDKTTLCFLSNSYS